VLNAECFLTNEPDDGCGLEISLIRERELPEINVLSGRSKIALNAELLR
jgi:hypothetical protein